MEFRMKLYDLFRLSGKVALVTGQILVNDGGLLAK